MCSRKACFAGVRRAWLADLAWCGRCEGQRGWWFWPGTASGFMIAMVPDLHQPAPEIRALASRVCESLHEVRALFEAGEL